MSAAAPRWWEDGPVLARAAGARAERAASIAARHELAATTCAPRLRPLHERMADLNRRAEAQQRAAIRIFERATQLQAAMTRREVGTGTRGAAVMAAVAGAAGASRATSTWTGLATPGGVALSSDPIAAAANELEYTLGEGPGRDGARGPGLRVDGAALEARWPVYGPAITGLGVDSVTALPLSAADVPMGSVVFFGGPAGPPSPPVAAVADVTAAFVDLMLGAGQLLDAAGFQRAGAAPALIHQAAGVLSARRLIPVADALDLLRARAFATGQSLHALADRVVTSRDMPEDT